MMFENVTFVGPPVDDPALLDDLPTELGDILRQVNGAVAFRGGFHLRGACTAPAWHSLRAAWRGPESVAARYPAAVRAADVPFAQDALGDQFLLRDGTVHRLAAETGDLEALGVSLGAFLERVGANAVEYLALAPLLAFERDTGGRLEPGQLLSAYPPFCTKEAAAGVSLRAVPAGERLAFLADFARQVAGLADGTVAEVRVTP